MGEYPTLRHDGSEWGQADKWRASTASSPLSCFGVLHQVRGDWQFFKNSFGFNSWGQKEICTRCAASNGPPCDFRDTGPSSAWRQRRLSGQEWLLQQLANGQRLSPLFGAPEFDVHDVVPDWLHCVDLGVQADLVGNLFAELVNNHLPGPSREARVKGLWAKLQRWNRTNRPEGCFDNLTWEMIQQKSGSAPKLRGKGAEVRHILPFAIEMALEYQDGSPHRHTVLAMLQWLSKCCSLVKERPYPAEAAAEAARKVAQLWSALEAEARRAGDFVHWRIKPKLHLFQELLEFVSPKHGPPNTFHCYLDERIGGWVSQMACRRGGAKSGPNVALNCLNRYRAYAAEGL